MGEVPPLSRAQRSWFVAIAVLGAIYLFVLPPFQGADETPHWARAWSVAEGQIVCGVIPQSAIDVRAPFRTRTKEDQFQLRAIDAVLQAEPSNVVSDKYNQAGCNYPPYAYLIPAIAIRVVVYADGEVGKSEPIIAFYAGRAASWLFMCIAVFWFLRLMPAYRNVGLFFFSIPEVIDQTSSINTELTLFALMFVMLIAVVRAPTPRRIAVIGVTAILLTMIKPVFAGLGLVAVPALLELHAARKNKAAPYVLIGLALALVPIVVWKLWSGLAAVPPVFPEAVAPSDQLAFLVDHPTHIFKLFWNQLLSTFGHNVMRGSWNSVLGSFGHVRVDLPMAACFALLFALALSIYADHASAGTPPPITPLVGGSRRGRAGWFVAVSGIALTFPATVIAMYLYFTRVGADRVFGVQGRYYLLPLFMLLILGLRYAGGRWPRREVQRRWVEISTWVAAAACVWAEVQAISAVADSYWYTR